MILPPEKVSAEKLLIMFNRTASNLLSTHKWLFQSLASSLTCPISLVMLVLILEILKCIPEVKIFAAPFRSPFSQPLFAAIDLEQTILFPNGHYLYDY